MFKFGVGGVVLVPIDHSQVLDITMNTVSNVVPSGSREGHMQSTASMSSIIRNNHNANNDRTAGISQQINSASAATKVNGALDNSTSSLGISTPVTTTITEDTAAANAATSTTSTTATTATTTTTTATTTATTEVAPSRRSYLPSPPHLHPQDNFKQPLYRPAALRTSDYQPPLAIANSLLLPRKKTSQVVLRNSSAPFSNEPERSHWKPDSEAFECADDTCKTTFSLFERRHHCRKCGDVFCGKHSAPVLRLNRGLNYSDQGNLLRGCESCGRDYRIWLMMRQPLKSNNKRLVGGSNGSVSGGGGISVSGSGGISVSGSGRNFKTSNIKGARAIGIEGIENVSESAKSYLNEDGVLTPSSVPRDWSWSTF